VISKWKRAVIHLECATDSEHFYDRIKRIDQQRTLLEQGQISHEQFAEELAGRSRDIRFHGTALFLSHAGRRYLLTARHVVWDEMAAKRELEEEAQRAQSWPEHMQQDLLHSAVERAQNNIFSIIFRVPSVDEVIAKKEHREFLMNLGAGASFTVPYTFSDPELDLALISLDQRNTRFADELQDVGFTPISSDDIADGPDSEGQEVFTVGYPSATALIGQVSQHPASAHWSSSHFSLPVFSFGKVSMYHDALPFFWADMSIYPGNSGGPLIGNDRLVGIVSAQATLPIDDVPNVRTRIPFGRIIKSSFVRALLEVQEQKDKR
jgi:S1-C subfamily serine protease